MSPEKAKQILLACRPATADQEDPEVRAALAVVGRDSALAQWWQEEQQVQAALRERFRQLPVPATLRDKILAQDNVIAPDWWRSSKFQVMAVAAVLTILFALLFFRSPTEPATFADYRDRMVRTVVREYRMDVTTSAEQEIREFLRANQGHGDYHLPPGLTGVPLFGAGRLTWKGQPVSMICFQRQAGVLMYLFVIDRKAFPAAPGSQPEFAEIVRRPTASWVDGERIYVLATDASEEDLRTLIR